MWSQSFQRKAVRTCQRGRAKSQSSLCGVNPSNPERDWALVRSLIASSQSSLCGVNPSNVLSEDSQLSQRIVSILSMWSQSFQLNCTVRARFILTSISLNPLYVESILPTTEKAHGIKQHIMSLNPLYVESILPTLPVYHFLSCTCAKSQSSLCGVNPSNLGELCLGTILRFCLNPLYVESILPTEKQSHPQSLP